MYFSTTFFLTLLETSLAYLPDPDHCCKSVKVKKSETSLINGEVFKLDNLREHLVSEYFPAGGYYEYYEITYHVEVEEWKVVLMDSWPYSLEYSSNSTEVCPENAETWDKRGSLGGYYGVSEMKLVCTTPWYCYVILTACLLMSPVPVLCCCSYCRRLSKKSEKSENAAMEVHIDHENEN